MQARVRRGVSPPVGSARTGCPLPHVAAIAAATVAELILLPAVLVVTDDLLRRSAHLGKAWKNDPIFGPAPTVSPVAGIPAPSA